MIPASVPICPLGRTRCADERGGVWTLYENYIVGELTRNYAYGKDNVNINFYRIKVRKRSTLSLRRTTSCILWRSRRNRSPTRAVKAFDVLAGTKKEIGNGGIVCMADSPFPIDEKNCFIPSNII